MPQKEKARSVIPYSTIGAALVCGKYELENVKGHTFSVIYRYIQGYSALKHYANYVRFVCTVFTYPCPSVLSLDILQHAVNLATTCVAHYCLLRRRLAQLQKCELPRRHEI